MDDLRYYGSPGDTHGRLHVVGTALDEGEERMAHKTLCDLPLQARWCLCEIGKREICRRCKVILEANR